MMAAAIGFSAFSASALKNDDDALIEGAKLCTRYLPRQERQFAIPTHLLAAIASTESGRFHRALGLNLPWPWTINVEGTGYFFDTTQEAIDAVRGFQARGIASIDVGCMQVNLYHHPDAFATLDQAFDPAYNVAYGAQFLKRNFDEEGSWRKATADYHSRSMFYGEPYARLVYGAWSRIINKVADARAGRPVLSAAAAKPSYASAATHGYQPMHMHSVSVARDTTRENGVLIVRPDYSSQQSVIVRSAASSNMDDAFVTHPQPLMSPSDMIERSAIAPDGVRLASAATDGSHNAEIVKVREDGTTSAKGQFEPSSHVVHATSTDSAADSTAAPSSTATAPSSSDDSAKSPFVFNN
jgi:hypothetical protein